MPKGFTIEEKRILIEKFKNACSQSWMNFGYKKTSVDILCQEVGIAKGSFYTGLSRCTRQDFFHF